MTSVLTVKAWYKQAHIHDQLGAKAIWAPLSPDPPFSASFRPGSADTPIRVYILMNSLSATSRLARPKPTRTLIRPTRYALDSPLLQRGYSQLWQDLPKHFAAPPTLVPPAARPRERPRR